MSTKTSSKKYVGDPVFHKTKDSNQRRIFDSRFIWAEKGGGPGACTLVSQNRLVLSFLEDPNSVRTNFIKFNTNYYVYSSSNYPTVGCVLSGQQGVSVGVWYNPDITDEEIDRQTEILGGPWLENGSVYFPGDITQFVTQPKDPNYTCSIFVIIRSASTGYAASRFVPSYEFSDYQYEVKR
jgi:hypothetical protein